MAYYLVVDLYFLMLLCYFLFGYINFGIKFVDPRVLLRQIGHHVIFAITFCSEASDREIDTT